MDAVYPGVASALARGRRLRRGPQRLRTRTQPVTFAEIKEVDEDSELVVHQTAGAGSVERVCDEQRRRRDQLVSLSVRRTRRIRDVDAVIPEPPEECRATSEPPPPPAPPTTSLQVINIIDLDCHVSSPNP